MLKKVIKAGTIVMAFLCLPLANAAIIDGASNTLLTVTYTQGAIADGPLSFGLVALPTEVIAKFVLDPTSLPPPTPGGPIPFPFPNFFRDIDQVVSATITFGNGSWATSNLMEFKMNTDAFGVLENLSYRFEIVGGGIALNFPLRILGSQGGETFEYIYRESTYTLTQVTAPTTLALFGLSIAGLGWSRLKKE